MSDTSYYAPLDEQSANSIRAKYRLLRSRRSKSDLHAVNQASDGEEDLGANCERNCERNYETNWQENCETIHEANCKTKATEKNSYLQSYTASLLRDYTIAVHHLQRKQNRARSAARCNRSEHRRRPSNGRPNKLRRSSAGVHLDRTFNASANLICASAALFTFCATLLSSLLFLHCYVHFAWCHIIVPMANCLLTEYSSRIGSWARQLGEICKRSVAKLSASFHTSSYLLPFACLVVYFELYDLHFTFLTNFHGFLLLYVSVFFLPLSIGYLYLSSAFGAPDRQRKPKLNSTKNSKERSSKGNHLDQITCENHRDALSRINRTISLTLLCLVDYALVRNGLRILQRARMQELSIAYLVESFVDNLVNYDQPMFNYLPAEEHLPADRLGVLTALTILSFLRLLHGFGRLWFMQEHSLLDRMMREANGDLDHSESLGKPTNKCRRENAYRSKLRSYQKEATKKTENEPRKKCANQAAERCSEGMFKGMFESKFKGIFEFSFTAMQPVLFGSLSFAGLFVARASCPIWISYLILASLAVDLLIITLINLNHVDLLLSLPLVEELSSELPSLLFMGNGPNRTPASKRKQRNKAKVGTLRLINHLVLQNLLDLMLCACLLVLIGNSALLWFTLIGQLSFNYLNLKQWPF